MDLARSWHSVSCPSFSYGPTARPWFGPFGTSDRAQWPMRRTREPRESLSAGLDEGGTSDELRDHL
jgi:hypothetical protein